MKQLLDNKRGLKLQNYIISFFIMTAVILGTTFFIADLQQNSGIQVNASYNSTYNVMNESMQIANQTGNQLAGTTISSTAFQAGIIGGFPALKIVANGYNIIFNLVYNVADDLNLAPWIAPLLLGIVSILVLFALINALFNRES
jgi:hypothetical protein